MAIRRTAALLLLACILGAAGAQAARDFEVQSRVYAIWFATLLHPGANIPVQGCY
jgi:hypothetical protein